MAFSWSARCPVRKSPRRKHSADPNFAVPHPGRGASTPLPRHPHSDPVPDMILVARAGAECERQRMRSLGFFARRRKSKIKSKSKKRSTSKSRSKSKTVWGIRDPSGLNLTPALALTRILTLTLYLGLSPPPEIRGCALAHARTPPRFAYSTRCSSHISRYNPGRERSSSCVPWSAMRPWSSTRI